MNVNTPMLVFLGVVAGSAVVMYGMWKWACARDENLASCRRLRKAAIEEELRNEMNYVSDTKGNLWPIARPGRRIWW